MPERADRSAITEALFHEQRRRHPGHVLGRKRCEEIVDFVLDADLRVLPKEDVQ